MDVLKKGATGEVVKYVQAALNFQMFDTPMPLVVDGIFGPKTKQRCLDFQEDCNLVTDGIVGDLTSAALCTYVESQQHILIARTAKIRPRGPYGVTPPTPPQPVKAPPKLHDFPQKPTKAPEHPYIRFLNNLYIGAEGGVESNFTYDFREQKGENKYFAVANVTALWSRRVRKRLSFGLGTGFLFERALQREKEYESTAYLFARLNIKTLEREFRYGNGFGLPLRIEGRWVDPIGAHKAFCASVAFGPEISFLHDRVSLGLGANAQYCVDVHGRQTVSGVLGPTASVLFGGLHHRHKE